jgi:hypothetical protein
VRVFDRVARGEAAPTSDVDFLMTAEEGVSMFDLVGLWLDLQEMLGCEVSLITDDVHPQREHFMRNVYQDAIPL